jgi:hypothetical protein
MLVAVTAYVPAAAPAVKSPEEEIVPPVADQVTPVFVVPVMVAENCWEPPVWTDAELGVTLTATVAAAGGLLETDPGEPAVPAQPERLKAADRIHRKLAVLSTGYREPRGELPVVGMRAKVPSEGMVLRARSSG